MERMLQSNFRLQQNSQQTFRPESLPISNQVLLENLRLQTGRNILLGWKYLSQIPEIRNQEERLIAEISQKIKRSHKGGAYILSKSEKEIAKAAKENRLVAILARDKNGEITFLVACTYLESGTNSQGKTVLEVGALISNSEVTSINGHTNKEGLPSEKELVYPLNDARGWGQSQTYGAQVLEASVAQILSNYDPEKVVIIATARSNESRKALENAGFVARGWDTEFTRLSCSSECVGVKNHLNCPLQIAEDGTACYLMVYKENSEAISDQRQLIFN